MASNSRHSAYDELNEDGDRPAEDAVSETSTIIYNQEPYEEYKHRARALLRELYDESTAKGAEITRMEGGSYNRIIGVALPTGNGGLERLVLRIPRFELDAEDTPLLGSSAAVLAALKLTLPVPEVVRFDATEENALGRQYTLMRCLPGFCLNDILYYLPTEDKCALALRLARILHNIMDVHVPPGIGPLRADSHGQLRLGCYEGGNAAAPRVSESFLDFVCSRLDEQRGFIMEAPPAWRFRLELFDRLEAAARVLLRDASLSGRNVLFHTDIAARNILVEPSPTGECQITGVLDWDGAQTAPYEIACVCPAWLWAAEDGDVHENYLDPDAPVANDDCARIRETFVDEMERLEPGFMAVVRQTRDRCLREIYELARDGFYGNADTDALDRIEALATKLGHPPSSRVDPPASLP